MVMNDLTRFSTPAVYQPFDNVKMLRRVRQAVPVYKQYMLCIAPYAQIHTRAHAQLQIDLPPSHEDLKIYNS